MKRFVAAAVALLLLAAGTAGWLLREPIAAAWARLGDRASGGGSRPRPRPDDYRTLVEDAERWRLDLARRLDRADGAEARREVLDETRRFLETLLPEMMRCWLGTPWDFNGTAEQPGSGGIACGYFVSTVLRDAGFRVDRYQLAQQPSQNILRTFLPRGSLRLRVGVPYPEFAAEARALEPGVHVIGLDTHVAFLVVDGGAFRFIHSSGSRPWCVVDEDEQQATVLRGSNYRVLGNLTADRRVLARWLAGEKFPVRGAR